jgi:hypothetical protein
MLGKVDGPSDPPLARFERTSFAPWLGHLQSPKRWRARARGTTPNRAAEGRSPGPTFRKLLFMLGLP